MLDKEEMERRITDALKGESNEFTSVLSRLQTILRSLGSVPPESSERLPDFDSIWNRWENEKASLPVFNRLGVRNIILGAFSVAAMFLIVGVGWNFGLFRFSHQPSGPTYHASITNLYGRAYLLNTDGTPRVDLKNLDRIPAGETIYVEEGSFVDLSTTPDSSVRIRSRSLVNLEIISQDETKDRVVIYLREGSLLTKVSKLKKFSDFIVRTDMGEVHVRGTRFVTQVEDNSIKVGVASGKVSYSQKDSSEVEILPGFEVESSPSSITQKPISGDLSKKLAELDSVYIQNLHSMEKMIRSEDDLFGLFGILEQIHMENGKSVRGVVFGMNDGYLLVRTIDGEIKISQDKVLDVEKIR